MSLDNLNEKGVCCSLYVSYPKYRGNLTLEMFRMRRSGSADGVLNAPALNMMSEELKGIAAAERRGRSALLACTLPLELQVGLRFCPINGLSYLLEEVDAAKADFEAAASEFIQSFDKHVENARERWTKAVDAQTDLTDDERATLLEYGYSQLPTVPPSMAAFTMSMFSAELSVPGIPSLADVDAAEAVAAECAAKRVRSETTKQLSKISDNFVAGCRSEIQDRMVKFFESLNRTISEDKPINKRTVSRLGDFLASMRRLNFFKDDEVEKILGRIRNVCFPHGVPEDMSEVSGIKDSDTVKGVNDALSDIMVMLSTDVRTADDGTVDGIGTLVSERLLDGSEAEEETQEETEALVLI